MKYLFELSSYDYMSYLCYPKISIGNLSPLNRKNNITHMTCCNFVLLYINENACSYSAQNIVFKKANICLILLFSS